MAMLKILAKNMETRQSNDLRITYKQLRNSMDEKTHEEKSSFISDNVLALLESDFKGANIFLCYYPFGSEVNLMDFYQKLLDAGKRLFFPVSITDSHELYFYEINDLKTDFVIGTYQIMEPDKSTGLFSYNKLVSEASNSIVCITPGLVFDRNCKRIGYGGGFYDRFFSDKPEITKIAPVFNIQLVDEIDSEKHDIPMDYIVTENEILKGDRL